MFVAPSLFDPSILSAPVAAEVRNVTAKTLQMRPYQVKAHAAVYAALQHHRRVLVVSATGSGKTVLISHIIADWPENAGRILVLAHRKELIDQAKAKVEKVTGNYAAIEMAAHRADRHGHDHRVVVGSIQTQISGDGSKDKSKTRMQRFNPLDFGLLIVDEAHRSVSETYQRTINYYLNGNPNAKLIGFTATPDRTDKLAMGKVFEHVAFVYPMLDAINDGWIVAPRVQTVRVTGLDFSKIRTTAGDLNCADLERVLMYEKPLHGMAEPAMKLAAGRQTLVFCAGVGHAERLSEIFNRHNPGCSRVVHGKTLREHRRYIFDAFGRKEFQILCNVGIVTEGTDLPGIEVVILARPTKSRALFEQMAGRGVRPAADIAEVLNLIETPEKRRLLIAQSTKPFFSLIDFTGVAGRHKLVTCIAEGQKVLTDKGLVAIELVTNQMRVWDGLQFVPNSGVVFRGTKEVITYAGLTATPDHKVWTKKGWKTFGWCARKQIAIAIGGDQGKAVRETDNRFRGNIQTRKGRQIEAADLSKMRLRPRIAQGLPQRSRNGRRLPQMRVEGLRSAVADQEMRRSEISLLQANAQRISQLWGQGNPVLVPISKSYGPVDYEKLGPAKASHAGQNQERSALPAGQPSLGYAVGSVEQQQANQQRSRGTRIPPSASRVQDVGQPPCETIKARDQLGRNSCKPSRVRPFQKKLAKVFDIINAGPRRRFTVQGLIVSNCHDILGGNYDEPVRERAAKLAADRTAKGGNDLPADVMDDLEEAQRQIDAERRERDRLAAVERENRRHLIAKTEYVTKNVNVFDFYEVDVPVQSTFTHAEPPSERMVKALERHNIDASRLTKGQAGELIGKLVGRLTVPQAKLLLRQGWGEKDINKLTIHEASKLIDVTKTMGKRPRALSAESLVSGKNPWDAVPM